MPKQTQPSIPSGFSRAICTRDFLLRSDPISKPLRVEIGEPLQDVVTVDGMDWRCPVRIIVAGNETIYSCFGVDSLQSVLVAIGCIRSQLENIAEQHPGDLLFLQHEVDTKSPGWSENIF